MTYQEACDAARRIMCGMSSNWCQASCAEIEAELRRTSSIFVGNDPIRVALTGSTGTYVAPPPTGGGGTVTPGQGVDIGLGTLEAWIRANPLIAIAIAAGVVYLVTSRGGIGFRK